MQEQPTSITYSEALNLKSTELTSLFESLEKELIAFILNFKQLKDGKVVGTDLVRKFDEFLKKNSSLEILYQIAEHRLEPGIRDTITYTISSCYCLYFYATKTLNHLLHCRMYAINWLGINENLTRYYVANCNKLHQNNAIELYAVHTTKMILIRYLANRLYRQGIFEKIRLNSTFNILKAMCNNLKNKTIKPQILISLFIFENDDHAKYCLQEMRLAKENQYYFREIIDAVNGVETNVSNKEYNRLVILFAYHTRFYTQVGSVASRLGITGSHNGFVIPTKHQSILNINSFEIIYQELKNYLNESRFYESVGFLTENIHSPNLDYKYGYIIQTVEMMLHLITIQKICLTTLLEILDHIINAIKKENVQASEPSSQHSSSHSNRKDNNWKKNQSPAQHWQVNFDCLQFKVKILEFIRILDKYALELSPNHTNHESTINAELKETLAQLAPLEVEKKQREELSDKLISKDRTEIKKDNKRRQRRPAFQPVTQPEEPRQEQGEAVYDEMMKKAAKYRNTEDAEMAIEIYRELLTNNSLRYALRAVKVHLELASTYKHDNNKKKSLEHYQLAEKIAAEELRKEIPLEYKSDLTIQHNVAMEAVREITVMGLAEGKRSLPTHHVISADIPIPDFIAAVNKELQDHGFLIFLVGGYVRGFYADEHEYYDIDAVIIDHSFNSDKQAILYKAHSLLKKTFPICEVRSKKHPILCIQNGTTILELSPLKINPHIISQSLSFDQKLLLLLYEDALQRDMTDNCLFYDFRKKLVYDFFSGIEDIKQKRLTTVKPPEVSFEEDATRIFRVLRAIVHRSKHKVDLKYSPTIIDNMHLYCKELAKINKDRCFSEVNKLLFRKNALATWQFLLNNNLQHYFFLLPTKSDIQFQHNIIMSKALGNLDNRIKKGIKYNGVLVFALLFWGRLQEEIEKYKSPKAALTDHQLTQIATKLFLDPQLIFRMPQDIIDGVIKLWGVYLHSNKLVTFNKIKFSYHEERLAMVLSRLITLGLTQNQKAQPIASNSQHTFFNDRIKTIMKNFIRDQKIAYTYRDKIYDFYFSTHKSGKLSNHHFDLLKDLKRYFQIILGKQDIEYSLSENSLEISTHIMHKKRAIEYLLAYLYEGPALSLDVKPNTQPNTSGS